MHWEEPLRTDLDRVDRHLIGIHSHCTAPACNRHPTSYLLHHVLPPISTAHYLYKVSISINKWDALRSVPSVESSMNTQNRNQGDTCTNHDTHNKCSSHALTHEISSTMPSAPSLESCDPSTRLSDSFDSSPRAAVKLLPRAYLHSSQSVPTHSPIEDVVEKGFAILICPQLSTDRSPVACPLDHGTSCAWGRKIWVFGCSLGFLCRAVEAWIFLQGGSCS